jgi:hypothetical protein
LSPDSHDFNGELNGEAMSAVRPGWEQEPIMKEWMKFAQSQMGKLDLAQMSFFSHGYVHQVVTVKMMIPTENSHE